MTLFGVTDSQQRHARVKLSLNSGEHGAPEAGALCLCLRDCRQRERVAAHRRSFSDGRWYHVQWTVAADAAFTLRVNGADVELSYASAERTSVAVATSPRSLSAISVLAPRSSSAAAVIAAGALSPPPAAPSPQHFVPLVDFPAIGGHNDRGTVAECFVGLLHDVRVCHGGGAAGAWRLDDGPGSTVHPDSSGAANHALHRCVRPKTFVASAAAPEPSAAAASGSSAVAIAGAPAAWQATPTQLLLAAGASPAPPATPLHTHHAPQEPAVLHSALQADLALLDRHSASWLPVPHPPDTMTHLLLNRVVLAEEDRGAAGGAGLHVQLHPTLGVDGAAAAGGQLGRSPRKRGSFMPSRVRQSVSMGARVGGDDGTGAGAGAPASCVVLPKGLRAGVGSLTLAGGACDAVARVLPLVAEAAAGGEAEAEAAVAHYLHAPEREHFSSVCEPAFLGTGAAAEAAGAAAAPHTPLGSVPDVRDVVGDMRTWATPQARLWDERLVETLASNASHAADELRRVSDRCDANTLLPLYVATSEMLEPVVWMAWSGAAEAWLALASWAELERDHAAHGFLTAVPDKVSAELGDRIAGTHGRKRPSEILIVEPRGAAESAAAEGLAGMTFFVDDLGTRIVRFAHTPSFVPAAFPLKDAVAWATAPRHQEAHPEHNVPSHVLEYVYARPFTDSFVVPKAPYRVEAVSEPAVLRLLAACCRCANPEQVDAGVSAQFDAVLAAGIPSFALTPSQLRLIVLFQCGGAQPDSAAAAADADGYCDSDGTSPVSDLTPGAIFSRLAFQRIVCTGGAACGSSFLVSLSGKTCGERFILYEGDRDTQSARVDGGAGSGDGAGRGGRPGGAAHAPSSDRLLPEEQWRFQLLWRVCNRHPHQILPCVNYAADAYAKGVTRSSVLVRAGALPRRVDPEGEIATALFVSPDPAAWHAERRRSATVVFVPATAAAAAASSVVGGGGGGVGDGGGGGDGGVGGDPTALPPGCTLRHEGFGWSLHPPPGGWGGGVRGSESSGRARRGADTVALPEAACAFELGGWLFPKCRDLLALLTHALANVGSAAVAFNNAVRASGAGTLGSTAVFAAGPPPHRGVPHEVYAEMPVGRLWRAHRGDVVRWTDFVVACSTSDEGGMNDLESSCAAAAAAAALGGGQPHDPSSALAFNTVLRPLGPRSGRCVSVGRFCRFPRHPVWMYDRHSTWVVHTSFQEACRLRGAQPLCVRGAPPCAVTVAADAAAAPAGDSSCDGTPLNATTPLVPPAGGGGGGGGSGSGSRPGSAAPQAPPVVDCAEMLAAAAAAAAGGAPVGAGGGGGGGREASSGHVVLQEVTEIEALDLFVRRVMAEKSSLDPATHAGGVGGGGGGGGGGGSDSEAGEEAVAAAPISFARCPSHSIASECGPAPADAFLSTPGVVSAAAAAAAAPTAAAAEPEMDELAALEQCVRVLRRVAAAREAEAKCSGGGSGGAAAAAEVRAQLTAALEETIGLARPLVRSEGGWRVARALLAAGADRRPLDKLLRQAFAPVKSGDAASPVDVLDRVMRLLACGANCAISNGEVPRFSAPFHAELTPLHVAAAHGRAAYVGVVARVFRVGVDAVDVDGRTALHLACEGHAYAAAANLLDVGASALVQDHEGRTALHLAVFRGCASTAAGFEMLKLVAFSSNVRARDAHGLTAEELAVERGQAAVATFLQKLAGVLVGQRRRTHEESPRGQ